MRVVAAFVILFVVACGGSPTPKDVAGVYDYYSYDGEIVNWDDYEGAEESFTLHQDGNTVFTRVDVGGADTTRTEGHFSVTGIAGDCVSIEALSTEGEEAQVMTICGEMLTFQVDGTEHVWRKRR